MTAFDFNDYKNFVLSRLAALPKGGRGELRKMAAQLGVHTTLMSQVFSGPKARDLTIEQAAALAEYFGLPDKEAQYFVALVERARAGTPTLKQMIERRLQGLRTEAQQLAQRLPQDRTLTEKEQGIFYSRWTYSGVRLFAPLMSSGTPEAIAARLGVSRDHVAEVLEFLLSHGLLVRDAAHQLQLGASRIHVSADSPLVGHHHRNWRMRALQRLESTHRLPADELMFSMPMSVADSDRGKIRALILSLIDEVSKIVSKSEPDCLSCLNLDWVKIAGR
jgi:uncharacterized protein (TIGR02147 family)